MITYYVLGYKLIYETQKDEFSIDELKFTEERITNSYKYLMILPLSYFKELNFRILWREKTEDTKKFLMKNSLKKIFKESINQVSFDRKNFSNLILSDLKQKCEEQYIYDKLHKSIEFLYMLEKYGNV